MRNVSFGYPDEKENAVQCVSLHINQGEFVAIGGPSGCGKTTLLKLLKKELTPVGKLTGSIHYKNQELDEGLSSEIGYVFQNPENQMVMDNVLSELVFGLENHGVKTSEMRQRVAEMVDFFGLEELLHEDTITLSGGQKQLINLASILLLKPKVLLLDEPTSQLDPVQAKEFLQFLRRLNEEFGITIILVEHRLEDVYALADKLMLMASGKLVYHDMMKDVIDEIWKNQDQRFLPYLPSLSKLFFLHHKNGYEANDIPVTVKEAQNWLNHSLSGIADQKEKGIETALEKEEKVILQIRNLHFKYSNNTPYILKNLTLDVREGELLAIVGGNGSGKTTLLKCCVNMLKPLKGRVELDKKKIGSFQKQGMEQHIGYLPQNPLLCFMTETLEEELATIASRLHLERAEERINSILEELALQDMQKRHLHDCSGGEQQKAALATILLHRPRIMLIDEPTKGMDPISKQNFAGVIKQLQKSGITIIMVTHDIEFVAEHATRCAWLFDGEISSIGRTEDVLKGNYFYTTTINRVTRDTGYLEALTLEEASAAWKNPILL
ncbi:ABC transporter ATP-binding protein [Bacillus sp. THAF10]|uniref:ABC transporter ATP-binding protein n=1 Tax=Bacillus sp. THAF10 TaxID=2587848 RepID=UPI001C12B518|nr:energy-coupling factor transporter ATPase [Bacillus sp. THAF10]